MSKSFTATERIFTYFQQALCSPSFSFGFELKISSLPARSPLRSRYVMGSSAERTNQSDEATKQSKPSRLASLDALRGFDMFWIVGAEPLVKALAGLSDAGWAQRVSEQLGHKAWEGFAFYDLIFPLFIFIVGVSLVFSLSQSLETHGLPKTLRRVGIRALILYLLGLIYYEGIANGTDQLRLLGVLQRIALCYLAASLVFCFLGTKGRVAVCVLILGGYWALLSFVPMPGGEAGNFAEGKNLTNYVDSQFLPFRKWDGDHDPEGLLSTFPAIATCLLGVFAGTLLRSTQIKDAIKVVYLLAAGASLTALGYFWGLEFPIIKKLWTSSYVLVAAGYSCLFLALFYLIIEIIGFKIWARPFIWIGMNPITIYLAHRLINFEDVANWIVGGPIKATLGAYGEILVLAVVLGMTLALVRFLYRKEIFLRV